MVVTLVVLQLSWGGGDENEGDEGGARLVRAHGGEKSRAPHPLWRAGGEMKEVWKGTIYPAPLFALSPISYTRSLILTH